MKTVEQMIEQDIKEQTETEEKTCEEMIQELEEDAQPKSHKEQINDFQAPTHIEFLRELHSNCYLQCSL